MSRGSKNARLDLTLLFNNSQSAKLTAGGKFSVYRPDFVGLTNDQFACVMVKPGTTVLSVGTGTGAPDDESVQFDVLVQSRKRGWITCPQLIVSSASYDTRDIDWCRNITEPQLDNVASMCSKLHVGDGGADGPHYFDAPSIEGIYSYANKKDSFQVFVQFTPVSAPPSDTGSNIPITLAILGWDWEGHSANFGGTWYLDLVQTNQVSTISIQPSDQFPVWQKVHHNDDPFWPCF